MIKNLKIRNSALIIIGMLMVSAILFSATTVHPAMAQVPTGMFLVPQDTVLYNAEVGSTFLLNVSIANVMNFSGIEWHLEWNSSLMNCTGMTEVLFHTVTPPSEYTNIWSLKLTKDNVAGTATYAQLFQDYSVAVAGGYAPVNITSDVYPEGLATAILNFTVTLVPPVNSFYECDLNFTAVKVGDPDGNDLNITGQNGHYRIYGPPEITDSVITYNNVNYTVTTATNATFVPQSMTFAKLNDTSYQLEFSLVGTEGNTGYVNVTIPKALMDISNGTSWIVDVNGAETTPVFTSDGNNTYIYATAPLTLTNTVDIFGTIPEYTMLFIPVLMGSTLVAFALRRRRKL